MNKKRKKVEPFAVGDRVWIESTAMYFERDSFIEEYEIIKVNKTSAYATRVKFLGTVDPSTTRIIQSTHEVVNPFSAGYHYICWKSKEAWESSLARRAEKKELKKLALDKVGTMSLNELRDFIGIQKEEQS